MTTLTQESASAATRRRRPTGVSSPGVVNEEQLARLPPALQRYLRYAGVIGRPVPATVHLRQRGEMRLQPRWPWMPFTARQRFTTDPPGFVWWASLKPLPFWPVRARDSFADGHGRMTVWPAPRLKLVDAQGPDLDQGELLRFVSELPWFPAACILPYLRWEAEDDCAARVTMTAGEVSAAAVFHIAPDGSVKKIVARRRWTDGKGPARLISWSGRHAGYRDIGGVRVPTRALATWHLPEGDYDYVRARTGDFVYDPPGDVTRVVG